MSYILLYISLERTSVLLQQSMYEICDLVGGGYTVIILLKWAVICIIFETRGIPYSLQT